METGLQPKKPSNFGKIVRGVNHIGITVDDIEKSLEFYTEVLGGKLIIQGTGLAGDVMHNTLLQKEELDAIEIGVNDPKTIGVPNLRDGEDNLDVYFIQFDNVVIELLNYRDASSHQTFNARNPHSSPAFINSMHISFHLPEDIDVDQFAKDLEDECQKRGMKNVRCNRIIRVNSEAERKNAELQYNSCKLADTPEESVGDFDGWTLFYLKGPNGEQLEFNQVTRKAKALFEKVKQEFLQERQSN